MQILGSSLCGCLRRLQGSAFQVRPSATDLLRESLRLPARQGFGTLAQSLYNRPTKSSEKHIALLMREPQRAVQTLLAKNRVHNLRFERRRNFVGRASSIRSYCETFKFPQQLDYLDLVRTDKRSRIVVSFHSGDFLYGCARLFSLESSTRRKYVLSLNRSSDATYTNLATVFGSGLACAGIELLLHRCSSAQLSQLLREGNTSLLLFCDVPPGLNESARVRFLNRPAWFSIGPALLALANRVPLLPLVNYSEGGSNFIRLGRQIEPLLGESETLREGSRRITQDLVTFFESVFLDYPEQWRFMALLPAYFAEPSSSRT